MSETVSQVYIVETGALPNDGSFVSRLELPFKVERFEVKNNFGYVISGGLPYIVDLTDNTNLSIIWNSEDYSELFDLKVDTSRNIMYMVDSTDILMFDISDKSSPILIGSYNYFNITNIAI